MKREKSQIIDGFVVLDGQNYRNLKIDGEVTFSNEINSGVLHVDGKIICEKKARIKSIYIDGIGQFAGDIFVEDKVYVDGKLLLGDNTIEASDIRVDGTVETKKNIIGKNIEIDGYVNATNIRGKRVTISDWKNNSKVFSSVIKKFFPNKIKISKVDNICGETIDISYANVDTMEGKKIVIGKNCVVKKLICEREPLIHKDSTVEEIIRKRA